MIVKLRRISTHTVVSEIKNGDMFLRTNILGILNSIEFNRESTRTLYLTFNLKNSLCLRGKRKRNAMLKSVSNDSDTSNFFSLTTVLVPGQDTFFFLIVIMCL